MITYNRITLSAMSWWALECHKIWDKASWFRGFYCFVTLM